MSLRRFRSSLNPSNFFLDEGGIPGAKGAALACVGPSACAVKGGCLPTPMELCSAKGLLNLGTNVGAAQHQFTDALYGTVGKSSLEKTVVVDGVGPPRNTTPRRIGLLLCLPPGAIGAHGTREMSRAMESTLETGLRQQPPARRALMPLPPQRPSAVLRPPSVTKAAPVSSLADGANGTPPCRVPRANPVRGRVPGMVQDQAGRPRRGFRMLAPCGIRDGGESAPVLGSEIGAYPGTTTPASSLVGSEGDATTPPGVPA